MLEEYRVGLPGGAGPRVRMNCVTVFSVTLRLTLCIEPNGRLRTLLCRCMLGHRMGLLTR